MDNTQRQYSGLIDTVTNSSTAFGQMVASGAIAVVCSLVIGFKPLPIVVMSAVGLVGAGSAAWFVVVLVSDALQRFRIGTYRAWTPPAAPEVKREISFVRASTGEARPWESAVDLAPLPGSEDVSAHGNNLWDIAFYVMRANEVGFGEDSWRKSPGPQLPRTGRRMTVTVYKSIMAELAELLVPLNLMQPADPSRRKPACFLAPPETIANALNLSHYVEDLRKKGYV